VLASLKQPSLDDEQIAVLVSLLRGFDKVPLPLTRARYCLVWLARDMYDKVPDEAGDILRSVANTFHEEAVELKLQALGLAIVVRNDDQALGEYVLELGEFDAHFDVRDWARFLSKGACELLSESGSTTATASGRGHSAIAGFALMDSAVNTPYRIDSLSFLAGRQVPGYAPLPDWATETRLKYTTKKATTRQSSSSSSGTSSSSSSSSSEEDSSEGETESEESSESEREKGSRSKPQPARATISVRQPTSSAKPLAVVVPSATTATKTPPPSAAPKPAPVAVAHPPPSAPPALPERAVEFKPLLSHVRGQGMQIDHWFSRDTPHEEEKSWTAVRLRIANKLDDRPISRIRIESNDAVKPLSEGIEMLAPGFYRDDVKILVAFKGHWRTPVKFTVAAEEIGKVSVEIRAPVGELLIPDPAMTIDEFAKLKKQLAGMNETSAKIANPQAYDVAKRVLYVCNLFPLQSATSMGSQHQLLTENLIFRFAGRRSDPTSTRVLIEVDVGLDGMLNVSLNCEYALAGEALMEELKTAFRS